MMTSVEQSYVPERTSRQATQAVLMLPELSQSDVQIIILIGVILLTASNGATQNGWVICYAFAQFIFGFGIGGEYPVILGPLSLCPRA